MKKNKIKYDLLFFMVIRKEEKIFFIKMGRKKSH